jgi:hypothetical protein
VALIACLDVVPAAPGDERLRAWYVDYPARGSVAEAAALEIRGWVIGRHAPAVAVEILHEGRLLRRVPVDIRRDDVAGVHPQALIARGGGYDVQTRDQRHSR